MKRSILISLALASTMFLASCATSNTSTAPAPAGQAAATYAVFADDGVAILGADPVAYFTVGEYTPGSGEFTYEWEGALWQFASAENRDLFAANPEDYAPQYGGFCAYAVSQGNTAPIEPTAWKIVDGKLYLNFNDKIQKRWAKDIPGYIAQADENWPGVLAN
ncbi:YHS domain-containing (seleno)protein [Leptothoe kymatousa]|uniref:YHS domain-containing protein n=1 Tax=Leptothoe kymatousa TAU-MAC 1615 TaxID=2364775 RepID=A0ABS5Y3C5_9CYAN|nr:YHS domain-containing (seleno)protein [Leptothoe kymatousa]MBT9311485.1 YHS domain-containing protein [Leptothoe kymatousa TAU-MAC 1615]